MFSLCASLVVAYINPFGLFDLGTLGKNEQKISHINTYGYAIILCGNLDTIGLFWTFLHISLKICARVPMSHV